MPLLSFTRIARRAWALVFVAIGLGAAGAPADMPAGRWRVDSIGGVTARAESTLEITPAGDVFGSGACNRFHGRAEISGRAIRFGALAATRMMCGPQASDQETDFFKALEATRRWEADPAHRTLILRDGEDRELVRFVASE
jgi:putative lipoprotein